MPQSSYHKSHYFFSVAHFSLANLIKLTLFFAGRKQQFDSHLFVCHPLNALFAYVLVKTHKPISNSWQLLHLTRNWNRNSTCPQSRCNTFSVNFGQIDFKGLQTCSNYSQAFLFSISIRCRKDKSKRAPSEDKLNLFHTLYRNLL